MINEDNKLKLQNADLAIKALENKSILKFIDAIKDLDLKDNLIIEYVEFIKK